MTQRLPSIGQGYSDSYGQAVLKDTKLPNTSWNP